MLPNRDAASEGDLGGPGVRHVLGHADPDQQARDALHAGRLLRAVLPARVRVYLHARPSLRAPGDEYRGPGLGEGKPFCLGFKIAPLQCDRRGFCLREMDLRLGYFPVVY